MKIKVIKNKTNGETSVNYYKAKNPLEFRFELVKSVLDDINDDLTIIIDTNQMIKDIDHDVIEQILNARKIKFISFLTKANASKFFGFSMDRIGKKTKRKEKMFIIDIKSADFNKELHSELFAFFDLAIGIKRNKNFDEIAEQCRFGFYDLLFNKDYFSETIYDSVICLMIRSSIDLKDKVK